MHKRCPGADVDNCTLSLSSHNRNDLLHGNERPCQVQIEDMMEYIEISFFKGGIITLTGIIDQDIDPPKMIHRLFHHSLDLIGLCHIGRNRY